MYKIGYYLLNKLQFVLIKKFSWCSLACLNVVLNVGNLFKFNLSIPNTQSAPKEAQFRQVLLYYR